jgi:tetrahydromethanopterin S-methyltransferase subunit B
MTTKFTKGPWVYDESTGDVITDDAAQRLVCDVMPVFEQHDKDGYLIAAAPEMYEMLETILQVFEMDHRTTTDVISLLEKARGEA